MNKKLLLILAFILLSMLVFSACGGETSSSDTESKKESDSQTDVGNKTDSQTDTESKTDSDSQTDTASEEETEADYKVKVVNFKGEPVTTGMFVQIYKDGEALGGMKKTNENGEAVFRLYVPV